MRLIHYFICFILLPTYAQSQEENFSVNENTSSVTALEGLPSSIVGGSVCAISGLYLAHSVDFALIGPETLVFERTYSSAPLRGNLGIGWNSNHRDWLRFKKSQYEGKDVWGCFMVEASGARSFYKSHYHHDDEKKSSITLSHLEPKGMTNASAGEISGRTNKKNIPVEWHPKKNKFVCYNGAKDCRTFHSDKTKNIYGVSTEKKVNGSSYRYQWHSDSFMHTNKMTCCNSDSKDIYSDVNVKI